MPRGYKIQKGIPCCANCLFGGYIGNHNEKDKFRYCICEIDGKRSDSRYYGIAVEPLGICEAWKPGD